MKTMIHPATQIGRVHYTVSDISKQIEFYRRVLGFKLLWHDDDTAALGAGRHELLRLSENPKARRARGTTGLYHTAFLVPSRRDLAHEMRQIFETNTPIQGTANHGTHLAIYLPDAEGMGIELAWDFPKKVWPMRGGKLKWEDMLRSGVDLQDLLGEVELKHRSRKRVSYCTIQPRTGCCWLPPER